MHKISAERDSFELCHSKIQLVCAEAKETANMQSEEILMLKDRTVMLENQTKDSMLTSSEATETMRMQEEEFRIRKYQFDQRMDQFRTITDQEARQKILNNNIILKAMEQMNLNSNACVNRVRVWYVMLAWMWFANESASTALSPCLSTTRNTWYLGTFKKDTFFETQLRTSKQHDPEWKFPRVFEKAAWRWHGKWFDSFEWPIEVPLTWNIMLILFIWTDKLISFEELVMMESFRMRVFEKAV